jgi:hypothetical protein
LGRKGYATLVDIIVYPTSDAQIALEAFDVLVSHLGEKALWPVLDSALKSPGVGCQGRSDQG